MINHTIIFLKNSKFLAVVKVLLHEWQDVPFTES